MSRRFTAASALLALLLSTTAARAQPSAAAPAAARPTAAAGPDAEASKELERKALELLKDTIDGARALKLVENRVRVQALAAGALWPRDEEAARALFREASDGVRALGAAADPADPQYHNTVQVILQLRNEMLQVVAQRDASLALEFLRATRQPPPQYSFESAEHRPPDQELMMEAQLAGMVAAQDPKQALRMAEESLGRGVSSGLLNVLYGVREKDGEGASKLATAIIGKLSPENLMRDYDSSNVALQLLSMTRVAEPAPAAAATRAPSAGVVLDGPVVAGAGGAAGQIVLDERTRRALVETIAAAAANSPADRSGNYHNIFSALQAAMPEVEKYAPTRVAALRRRMAEFERNVNPRARAWREHQAVMQQGTVESLLEAAPKAPREVRDQLYVQAAWKAAGDKDVARARQIVENISNPQQRAQMLRDLDRQAQVRAAEQGDFEAARQLLARLTAPEERIQMLVQLSDTAYSKGDKGTARELLAEARGAVAGQAQNQAQFYALLQIAHAYAKLDAGEAFAVVETAISQLDTLLAAAAVLDGFAFDAFKEGELKPQSGYMWNDLIGRCAAELAALAPSDFARARAAAESFRRTDARTTAQLVLAQTLLADPATRGQSLPPRGRRAVIFNGGRRRR